MGLGVGRNFIPSQKNNGLMPLPPIYTLRDENCSRLNRQSIYPKVVKVDDAEIEISIWNNDAAELFQEGYRDKRHEPIFHHLRNIISNRFKRNVSRSLVFNMVYMYGPSSSVCHVDSSK